MVNRIKSPKGLRPYLFLSLLLGHLLYATCAVSSVVAVVDGGIDTEHPGIRPHLWINSIDLPGDSVDQDGNGKVDDIFGWNFVSSSPNLLDRSYIGILNGDLIKYFNLSAGSLLASNTEKDVEWLELKLQDRNFARLVEFYGGYMHGTHVAGIAVAGGQEAQGVEVLGLKMFGDRIQSVSDGSNKLSSLTREFLKSKESNEEGNQVSPPVSEEIDYDMFRSLLTYIANTNFRSFGNCVKYLAGHRADVANFSFEVSYSMALTIVGSGFSSLYPGRYLDYRTLDEFSRFYINYLNQNAGATFDSAPYTLFVSAAGNDNFPNDHYPHYPSGAKSDNNIVVAASYNSGILAPFSNYGVESVDVAAPGVAISSAVPGGGYLQVSGTSQAAPYVSNVAAIIFDINPNLMPVGVKKIIMETVDVRSFLLGRVKSGGIVNRARALKAAELSKEHPLPAAISMSFDMVPDFGVPKSIHRPLTEEIEGLVAPLPNPFF